MMLSQRTSLKVAAFDRGVPWPLAVASTFLFFDAEFADDTIQRGRTRVQVQHVLLLVQEEAAKYLHSSTKSNQAHCLQHGTRRGI